MNSYSLFLRESRIVIFLSSLTKHHHLLAMTGLKKPTSDCVVASESAITDTATPAELPSDAQTIEPLDVVEPEPIRTKLRTYATLLALYVRDLFPDHRR
jgi:hypothetical protein